MNERVYFNIGLGNNSAGTGLLSPGQRAIMLEQELAHGLAFSNVRDYAVHFRPESEPTAVFSAAVKHGGALRQLVHKLEQDCIAVYYPTVSRGDLFGPRADVWGDFNKEFFIMPEVF